MSGFSAAWLALREPADIRARNAGIAGMLRDACAGRERVAVADLGCGTGSSVRTLAALLPAEQAWHLYDNDADLLAAARSALAAWAETAAPGEDDTLVLTLAGHRLTVAFHILDLRGDFDAALPSELELINASALIDLVSDAGLDQLGPAVIRRRAALLTTLSYAGVERWRPVHPADPDILAAFNAHQQGDKGFGPALGPRASEVLSHKLRRAGYEAVLAPSPWRLKPPRDTALIAELAAGIAAAAAETGQVSPTLAAEWRRARRAARSVEIAHVDLLGRLP
jgi:hypothetical protein